MSEKVIRQEVSDACKVIANTGLAELFTGHVSRESDNQTIYIPAHLHESGRGIESIQPKDVIEVGFDGVPTTKTEEEPPDELIIHSSILDARDDIHSVAHAHPLYATALSMAGVQIKPASFDAALLDGGANIYDPGPRLLYDSNDGEGLVNALADNYAVVARGHGAITAGKSVAEATARMWFLERAARMQVIAEQVGGTQSFSGTVDSETFLDESPEDFLEASFEFLRTNY